VALETAKVSLGDYADKINFVEHSYACAEGADALIICTEWREFRTPDLKRLTETMSAKVIFDGRNLYDDKALKDQGFEYFGVGRKL